MRLVHCRQVYPRDEEACEVVRVVGWLAACLGHIVRFILALVRMVVAALPFGLVVGGVALFDWRVAMITAGVLLWAPWDSAEGRKA